MSAVGLRTGLPKRTFYSSHGIYYLESGEEEPQTDACDLGMCLFKPNKEACPRMCGCCDIEFAISACDLACHPCNLRKCTACKPKCGACCEASCAGACPACDAALCEASCDVCLHPGDLKRCCDVCVPLCGARCPAVVPCVDLCCDCAHPVVGYKTEVSAGTLVFKEGMYCVLPGAAGGSACTYLGKCAGGEVVLKNDGAFVPFTEELKYAPPGKAAPGAAPAQQQPMQR